MEAYPDTWSMNVGKKDGDATLIIRIRDGLGNIPPFPILVLVNMDWVDNVLQTSIEDDLVDLLEKDGMSLFVMSLTEQGNKRFVFYTKDPEKTRDELERYVLSNPDWKITYGLELDPTWDFYSQYTAQ